MRRPVWLPWVEAWAILVFTAFLMLLAVRLAHSPPAWTALLLAALAGFAAADFVSGFVHWFCDTFFEEDTPGIGGWLISPFREHHRDPLALTRHGFLELTGNSCLALLPLLGLAAWWEPNAFAGSALLSFSIALFGTNVFHRWAHAATASRAVRWLQVHRFILSPAQHALHHQSANRGSYCVTTGWINHILDRAHAFEVLERVFQAAGLPRAKSIS